MRKTGWLGSESRIWACWVRSHSFHFQSIDPSIRLSIHPYVYPSIQMSIHTSHLSVDLSISRSPCLLSCLHQVCILSRRRVTLVARHLCLVTFFPISNQAGILPRRRWLYDGEVLSQMSNVSRCSHRPCSHRPSSPHFLLARR